MSEQMEFKVGDEVMAVAGAKGTIVDIKKMSNEEEVYGVLDLNGAVRYYTENGLKSLL